MHRFTKNSLPDNGWHDFRKMSITQAQRISGPFEVETLEGTMSCEDGWLALDSHGNPYPIAHHEFIAIYTPVAPHKARA